MWYPVKVLHIRHNLFAGAGTPSLSVHEPIAMRVLWERGVPPFGGGVELMSRVWYHVKVLNIMHNLFAGAETLSLPVYEPIAICITWGTIPNCGRGMS